MKTGLFIGRFQPFHSGHVSVLQALANDDFTHVIIGIGSAQYSRRLDNPLTLAERITCIAITLNQLTDIPNYWIVSIPDIHDDDRWVSHVDHIVRQVTAKYTTTYTGNSLVTRLFEQAGKPVQPVHQSIIIDGTTIRAQIREQNSNWRQYVNPNIQDLIGKVVIASTHAG